MLTLISPRNHDALKDCSLEDIKNNSKSILTEVCDREKKYYRQSNKSQAPGNQSDEVSLKKHELIRQN